MKIKYAGCDAYNLVEVNRRFGGTYYLCLCCFWLLDLFIFFTLKMMALRYSETYMNSTKLYSVTFQKIELLWTKGRLVKVQKCSLLPSEFELRH
jgi:hypothetical protein